ncbi:50S ribosomal protein L9 [Ruficoccus amylovorans]|uniref:Large ribosomal subunit protein bL9 n=1 Tax=Ruficoccus amylovorans TaxID=1804625 RepID=A0A842HCV3_9BACT|nr:50S ribosomal protein L9 [Ruficoccus amylovorans]MBC2593374.1 50S ribosomal protein L9 [Ruficoccus amylovorans]
MATTDILLLEPVTGLGGEGDQVTVKAGYARNFLLPRKLALPVNRANQKYIDALQKRRAEREAKELGHAQELAAKIEKVSIAIAVKTGEGGKMFGSVTAQDLIDRLAEEGVELERKQLNLYTPVKALGKHATKVKLHPEVTVEFEWEVVSENPIEENEEAEAPKAE